MATNRFTLGAVALACGLAFAYVPPASAVTYNGIVQFTGTVSFPAPIAGITATGLTVRPATDTEATGNGEHCTINSTTGDNPDGLGAYPDAGQVSADMSVDRGGPNIPDGQCLVTIRATGTDGVSVSAHGSQIVWVDAADINTSATVPVSNITVRESKAVSGTSVECRKYVKRQLKARSKCNFLLLKKGPVAAEKCKDFSIEEPSSGCDPGNFVDVILAFAHGTNDQQTDAVNADDIDEVLLKDQIICQKRFGKAATGFVTKRMLLVQKQCIDVNGDDQSCRDAQTNTSKTKLDQISKCVVDQMVDGGTGRKVPDVGAPCDVCIDGLGVIDTKCLKGCFQLALNEMSDGIIGDLPECGNGIVQNGEFCDDGNTTPGDCCSASCAVEAGTTEGPAMDPTCTDGLDNDCDGNIDGADTNCQ